MQLSIRTFGKSHKALIITGPEVKVTRAAEQIDGQRQQYKMDYADLTVDHNGQAEAEFVSHRRHHKKAAEFIRGIIG